MIFLRSCLFILILTVITSSTQAHSIDEIRKNYQLAVYSSSITDKLSLDLKKITKPDALTLAYIASLEALKAKHSWNPYVKLQYMSAYEKLMNDAIKKMPENMEIRFLRYAIQYNTPSFLGFSKNLNEDKTIIVDAFLKRKFVSLNKVLISDVYHFMVETKSITNEEKLKMEKVLKNL